MFVPDKEDALRRDLNFNAFFFDIERTFTDCPLRVLRAVRPPCDTA